MLDHTQTPSAIRRYLKELGVQYERVFVDMNEKEHKADWYTKVCHTAVRCRFICCKKRVCTGARLL